MEKPLSQIYLIGSAKVAQVNYGLVRKNKNLFLYLFVMPWDKVIISLLGSLASSGKSSKDTSYNAFLSSIASKVMTDKVKNQAVANFSKFV